MKLTKIEEFGKKSLNIQGTSKYGRYEAYGNTVLKKIIGKTYWATEKNTNMKHEKYCIKMWEKSVLQMQK